MLHPAFPTHAREVTRPLAPSVRGLLPVLRHNTLPASPHHQRPLRVPALLWKLHVLASASPPSTPETPSTLITPTLTPTLIPVSVSRMDCSLTAHRHRCRRPARNYRARSPRSAGIAPRPTSPILDPPVTDRLPQPRLIRRLSPFDHITSTKENGACHSASMLLPLLHPLR